jgi:hypothetical protein
MIDKDNNNIDNISKIDKSTNNIAVSLNEYVRDGYSWTIDEQSPDYNVWRV